MGARQRYLWDVDTWESLVSEDFKPKGRIKKDLTYKVEYSYLFNGLRAPLDFNGLVELGNNKYSDFKVSSALLKSAAEYHGKNPEKLDFVDLLQMYESIRSIFLDKEVEGKDLEKWKKANGLSFFGPAQYNLMEKYLEDKDPRKS